MQLLQCYQLFMGAVLLISEGPVLSQEEPVCQQLKQLWLETEEAIAKQGWSKTWTTEAAFAVCVWADERLLLSPNAAALAWTPLQSQLYQTHCGGEEFFSRLEALLSRYDLIEKNHSSRPSLDEVLAVFGACLAAQFKGRYYHVGEQPIQQLRQRISLQLALPQGPAVFEVLPKKASSHLLVHPWRLFDPFSVLLIVAALLGMLLVMLIYQDLLAIDQFVWPD
jgi:type IV/VI secretion system ImpK/VasF family protein